MAVQDVLAEQQPATALTGAAVTARATRPHATGNSAAGSISRYLLPETNCPSPRLRREMSPCSTLDALPGSGVEPSILGHLHGNGGYHDFLAVAQYGQLQRRANCLNKQQLLKALGIGNCLFADTEEHIARPESGPLGG